MLTLASIAILLPPQSPLHEQDNLDSYLILTIDGQEHYLKTVKPDRNKFSWSLQADEIKIVSKSSTFLQISMVHYDTCQELWKDTREISQNNLVFNGQSYQHAFRNQQKEVEAVLRFVSGEQNQPLSSQNLSNYVRNSKKTSTTNLQESNPSSLIQKVHSLKNIVSHQRDLLTLSTSQSPKSISQLAYLRSFRQNLQKKLYTSIEMNSRPRKRYIV